MRTWKLEKNLYKAGAKRVCGLDEAGRGPLAGPVVAAAVILARKIRLPGLADSKKLTPTKREKLFRLITEKSAYGIGIVSNKTIDRIGIVACVGRAMQIAVKNLPIAPDCLLIDGIDNFQFNGLPAAFIEKGDNRVRSIMAASIIAKVARDRIMMKYDLKYPMYEFRQHKGYGTELHYKKLRKHGLSKIHRLTFRCASASSRSRRVAAAAQHKNIK
ncbi:ribonuclease HII [Candidatus Peregrinibacteria bacterium]|nr:ribonuclease HII [Candidatus Peregrinibacteria bacterium]